MKSTKAFGPYSELIATLDAVVAFGSDQRGISNTKGPNPLHYLVRHGWASASIIDEPIPMLNPAEFGSYQN